MELIVNEKLTGKLSDIEVIGNNSDDLGGIYGAKENGELISLSQEIYELVAFDLIDKKSKKLEMMNRSFKITVEQL